MVNLSYQMKRIYIRFRAFCLLLLDRLTRKKGISISFNGIKIKLPGRYYRYFDTDYEQDNFIYPPVVLHERLAFFQNQLYIDHKNCHEKNTAVSIFTCSLHVDLFL